MKSALAKAYQAVANRLLAELGSQGHWVGELSGSALSTATAVTALAIIDRSSHAQLINAGLRWLAEHANSDGGWGDTVRSKSNLSTTSLVWAAFGAAQADVPFETQVKHAEEFLRKAAGSLDQLPGAIEASYGEDRTFSVPIIMTLALSGRLGTDGWKKVRSLPFEMAALPRGLFGALRLPVVSYALPALIAIGQVTHYRAQRFHPLRDLTRRRTLEVLTGLQPSNGGFLEAIPLTSFVAMSLGGMRLGGHAVAERGIDFLKKSVRPDGCWPIDTNLSTWVTTLSVKALRHQPDSLSADQRTALSNWLIGQQHRVKHTYTGAAPGGWAWSDLPGAVPDADDTAGALLALWELRPRDMESNMRWQEAIISGLEWLLGIQNRDGGMPTFCRGWGALPFDRSTPELTAHALRAWRTWLGHVPPALQQRVRAATDRAIVFLEKNQRADGSWLPLWFANEHAPREENPVYGTAQVLQSLTDSSREKALAARAYEFLRANQNADGGWGGAQGAPSSIEETSMALEALLGDQKCGVAVERGVQWLMDAIQNGALNLPSPIGLYFARLWYFERLYPIIFPTSALGACQNRFL